MSAAGPEAGGSLFQDLRTRIDGDILCDDISRSLYSCGASIYSLHPQAVIRPRHRQDVSRVLRFADKHRLSVTARGAATGFAGNALGRGIIVDFTRYMNQIGDFDPATQCIRVQPGLRLADLNSAVKARGLYFPVDAYAAGQGTIGGLISNNAGDGFALHHGSTRDRIVSLEVVLADGTILPSTSPSDPNFEAGSRHAASFTHIRDVLPDILNRYGEALAAESPLDVPNASGYCLRGLIRNGQVDITPLIAGSEGTLALITEATLQLLPLPPHRVSGWLSITDPDQLETALNLMRRHQVSLLEFFDQPVLEAARNRLSEPAGILPPPARYTLLFEFQGSHPDHLQRQCQALQSDLQPSRFGDSELHLLDEHPGFSAADLAGRIATAFQTMITGSGPPLAFIEDGAVPPDHLVDYLRGLEQCFDRHGVTAGIFGHAAIGHLHPLVHLDLDTSDATRCLSALADDVHDLVLQLKGTISGGHGDGRLRTYRVSRQYPRLADAFREIKELLDPGYTLNPGMIVAGNDNLLLRHLKYGPDCRIRPTGTVFDTQWLRTEVENCTGCGQCRTFCPVARVIGEEWATGRGKANLFRDVLQGRLDRKNLYSNDIKPILDLCLNCKRCRDACPSGVDIAGLVLGARVSYIQKNRIPFTVRLLSHTSALYRGGSILAPVINRALNGRGIRRFLESLTGIDRRRRFPHFQHGRIRNNNRRPPDTGRRDKQVVLFLDCYTHYGTPPGNGSAAIDVLEHNGFDVIMPEFRCCGLQRIATGAVQSAMDDIQFNLNLMAAYLNLGLDIVFTEPNCALAVRREYPKIFTAHHAEAVANRCYDIHEFLLGLHRRGELNTRLASLPLRIGYHHPCHLQALGITTAPVELLRLIPDLVVQRFSAECCGLGTAFGYDRDQFALSLRIGDPLFRDIEAADIDEVATSCSTCGLQILQGTGRQALTPVMLLARAYGSPAGPSPT